MTAEDAWLAFGVALLLGLFSLFWYLFRFVRGKDQEPEGEGP